DLRGRLRASVREAESTPPKIPWWKWQWIPTLATAAVLAVALAATWAIVSKNSASDDDLLAKEIVSAHVRSMMEEHLMDVPSTDQHTVKPWFDGRLDFSPPVTDLSPQGFALIGGRLDYASGRAVAALVYQRRQHYINLFIYPAPNTANVGSKVQVLQGYNLIHWSRSGMVFWAVSDLNLSELQEFSQDLQN
ncbi:MAG: anti-sigma factor family protein, partial [Pyrinomonadaceae bacterium]